MQRYDRQIKYAHFGQQGQQKLRNLRVIVMGVGALGSGVAEQLVRSGVGHITLVDKDIVTMSNLHRQSCYVTTDAESMLPKVVALQRHLIAINPDVEIMTHNEEVTARNIINILEQFKPDVVLDGMDTFEMRYLLNEATQKLQIPYIYGAVVGSQLSVLPIHGDGPCLHCILPEVPETMERCEINGVLPPAVHMACSLIVAEVFRYLMHGHFTSKMTTIDIHTLNMRTVDVTALKESECFVCGQGQYRRLSHDAVDHVRELCGGVFQLRLPCEVFDATICPNITVGIANQYVKRLMKDNYDMTLYQDGRLLIYGASSVEEAENVRKQLFIAHDD
ncbi:dinucleotide-utilizing protein [Staphylococcus muscae]|uniref:HesA/MoeB/ThiF family protein n=1 Tax=Staphylococcus muscae TaxID=1294 RepID=A0A240BVB3_9STAP|nr:ThiF family adenylyltransferase [Staphylococcus muscae]AVQ34253.1 dinucleotide-utilizing protein [Staphylococcus muscae]PNZ03896.1 dinucleotide-utilizing protein [Staphylococcus muscae]GGA84800.1 thiazole biosynthesis adenylyltransferase ThiF [Staphylococcus muscae]SNV99737.1 HesA/MoeB/ThiF family protein [Staphylococcus muscae]